jgi:hypothetical protein
MQVDVGLSDSAENCRGDITVPGGKNLKKGQSKRRKCERKSRGEEKSKGNRWQQG